MKRVGFFNTIEEKLNFLSFRIEQRGKINLLDFNIHSENFFADLINLIFDYKLKNLNAIKQNVDGIDLVDEENKIIVQVSSTCTKAKIENSLSKKTLAKYLKYSFKFIALCGSRDDLKDKSFANPRGVVFDPKKDIYDISSLLRIIESMKIVNMREVYDLIVNELGDPIDSRKLNSNLAEIIKLLSSEDLSTIQTPEVNSFEIHKKIEFNKLDDMQDFIDEYKVYYNILDEKYCEFDKLGANKSKSVLSIIQKQYLQLSLTLSNPKELFLSVIESVSNLIQSSENYEKLPYEELDLCVSIIVVDAFIRCKIFKNPKGYTYATT